MVPLSKIKKEIIRKTMLKDKPIVILKGVYIDTHIYTHMSIVGSEESKSYKSGKTFVNLLCIMISDVRLFCLTLGRGKAHLRLKVERLRYKREIQQVYKFKRASERRKGIQTPILPVDAVRQTKEASATKVSLAWSYGDRSLSSGRKGCRDKGTL